jgi:hypothetical protein
MRFSGVVSARNHQDLVGFLAGPGRLKKQAWAASLLLIGCGFFIAFSAFTYLWFLGGLLRRGETATVLAQPHLVALVLLGLLMLLLTVAWLRGFGRLWSRLRSLPKDAEVARETLREGVNIGEMTFQADEQGLVVTSSLVRSTYAWNAFRQLAESERNLFLIVDAGAAVILPKAALGGESGMYAFKALAGPRIGGAE